MTRKRVLEYHGTEYSGFKHPTERPILRNPQMQQDPAGVGAKRGELSHYWCSMFHSFTNITCLQKKTPPGQNKTWAFVTLVDANAVVGPNTQSFNCVWSPRSLLMCVACSCSICHTQAGDVHVDLPAFVTTARACATCYKSILLKMGVVFAQL